MRLLAQPSCAIPRLLAGGGETRSRPGTDSLAAVGDCSVRRALGENQAQSLSDGQGREQPSRFLRLETLEKPDNSAILHANRAGGKGFWAFQPELLALVRLLLAGVSRTCRSVTPTVLARGVNFGRHPILPHPPPPERRHPSHLTQQLATKNPPPLRSPIRSFCIRNPPIWSVHAHLGQNVRFVPGRCS